MSAHTPGPWVAVISRMEGARIQQPGIGGTSVAWVGADMIGPTDEDPHERMSDEAQANARLIAAVPELLSACEWARDLMATGNMPAMERQRLGEFLRVAIAKARGGK